MARQKYAVIQENKDIKEPRKVTFDVIYADFRRRHPNLSREVVHWKPLNTLKIKIYMSDGMIIVYDYWTHRATICSANWRRDHLSLCD